MQCLSARRSILASPQRPDEEVIDHCHECAACAAYRREILQLDTKLGKALDLSMPNCLPARVLMRQSNANRRARRWRIGAIAASLTVALAAYSWIQLKSNSETTWHLALAHHIEHTSPVETTPPLRLDEINDALDRTGVQFRNAVGDVQSADPCLVGETMSAHLRLNTTHGIVSVFVMPQIDARLSRKLEFASHTGIVLPCDRGSIVIIGDSTYDFDELKRRVLDATYYI